MNESILNVDLFGEIKEFINIIIPIVFSVLVQLIKKIMEKRGKGFKRNDSWFIVVLCLGPVMAVLDQGLVNFSGFNWAHFIILAGAYSAGAGFFYQGAKIAVDRLKIGKKGGNPPAGGGVDSQGPESGEGPGEVLWVK